MRYRYEKTDKWLPEYGETYWCDHPLYHCCTLYKYGDVGVGVVQKRFDPEKKVTYWSSIDPWVANDIYLSPKFPKWFDTHARPVNTIYCYPTYGVREVMWALRIKPLYHPTWDPYGERFKDTLWAPQKKHFL